ncbi:MAG TPA: hypothetical protein VGD43_19005 [Micromonospora sp.]
MAAITDDERRQVRELHSQGLGRNEISRRTGIHKKRVSAIAADLGLSFVRGEPTRAVVEAKKADVRTCRAALVLALLDDVDQLRSRLHTTYEVHQFDKEGNLNTGFVSSPSGPRPLSSAQTNAATLAGLLGTTGAPDQD